MVVGIAELSSPDVHAYLGTDLVAHLEGQFSDGVKGLLMLRTDYRTPVQCPESRSDLQRIAKWPPTQHRRWASDLGIG